MLFNLAACADDNSSQPNKRMRRLPMIICAFFCMAVKNIVIGTSNRIMAAAWPSGSESRFYDRHDCQVDVSASLLRPWKRCFSTISYYCLMESNKQQIRSKTQAENSETKATPKRLWIRPTHSTPVASS